MNHCARFSGQMKHFCWRCRNGKRYHHHQNIVVVNWYVLTHHSKFYTFDFLIFLFLKSTFFQNTQKKTLCILLIELQVIYRVRTFLTLISLCCNFDVHFHSICSAFHKYFHFWIRAVHMKESHYAYVAYFFPFFASKHSHIIHWVNTPNW